MSKKFKLAISLVCATILSFTALVPALAAVNDATTEGFVVTDTLATAEDVAVTEDEAPTEDDATVDEGIAVSAEEGDNANSWRYTNGELTQTATPTTPLAATLSATTLATTYTTWPTNIEGVVAYGIDVSKWQGSINWVKVQAAGVDFAIIRCGYGQNYTSQDDPYWEINADACTELGIPFGVYLYSYADTVEKAISEAEHVLRLVEGYDLSYPIYYDLEDDSLADLSTSELAAIAEAFCSTIEAAGYEVGIYASKSWFETKLTDEVFDQWDKWVAQWNTTCTYAGEYTMWQCSENGVVDGISGSVDLNLDFGAAIETGCDHNYTQSEVVSSTCTEDGSIVYTCTECGDFYTETSDGATGHTEGEVVTENNVDPTCTEDGSYDSVVYCTVCNEKLSSTTVTVSAAGHAYEEIDSEEPTCTEDGFIIYECETCDDIYTVTLEATGHTEGTAVTENNVDPTCTEEGSYDSVVYCSVCGGVASRTTVTVSATGHDGFEEIDSEDPTCTEAGYITYGCSICGENYTVTLDATGHTGVETGRLDPTCTEDGYITYKCEVCYEDYAETLEATGHTEADAVIENNVDPTCTEDGSYDSVVYCSVCGEKEEMSRTAVTVSATGHTYVEATEDSLDPTCTEAGYTTYKCEVCEDTYTETVSATGHTASTAVTENEISATCIERGSYDSVVYCSVCGEEMSRTAVIVLTTEHTGIELDRKDQTCTEDGYVTYECEVCNETYTVDLDATGHDFIWVIDQAATVTEEGAQHQVCSVCGEIGDSEVIPVITEETAETEIISASDDAIDDDNTASADDDAVAEEEEEEEKEESDVLPYVITLVPSGALLTAISAICTRKLIKV